MGGPAVGARPGWLDVEGLEPRAVGSRKARSLVRLLALARGRVVATRDLVEALWGDAPPANPADQVAVLVSRLRGSAGAGADRARRARLPTELRLAGRRRARDDHRRDRTPARLRQHLGRRLRRPAGPVPAPLRADGAGRRPGLGARGGGRPAGPDQTGPPARGRVVARRGQLARGRRPVRGRPQARPVRRGRRPAAHAGERGGWSAGRRAGGVRRPGEPTLGRARSGPRRRDQRAAHPGASGRPGSDGRSRTPRVRSRREGRPAGPPRRSGRAGGRRRSRGSPSWSARPGSGRPPC